MNFFDPLWTSEGKLYAPQRLQQIVQERYIISKNCNTSYIDTIDITPLERTYLLQFIKEEIDAKKQALEECEYSHS